MGVVVVCVEDVGTVEDLGTVELVAAVVEADAGSIDVVAVM